MGTINFSHISHLCHVNVAERLKKCPKVWARRQNNHPKVWTRRLYKCLKVLYEWSMDLHLLNKSFSFLLFRLLRQFRFNGSVLSIGSASGLVFPFFRHLSCQVWFKQGFILCFFAFQFRSHNWSVEKKVNRKDWMFFFLSHLLLHVEICQIVLWTLFFTSLSNSLSLSFSLCISLALTHIHIHQTRTRSFSFSRSFLSIINININTNTHARTYYQIREEYLINKWWWFL